MNDIETLDQPVAPIATYTVRAASKIFHKTPKSIRDGLKGPNPLPHFKLGGKILFEHSAIRNFIAEQTKLCTHRN